MKTVLEEIVVEGAVSFEKGEGWIKPWHLPNTQRNLFPSPEEGLFDKADRLSGVRLRFCTDSSRITLVVNEFTTMEPEEPTLFDLVIVGKIVQTVELAIDGTEVVFDGLPFGEKLIEIWLPQFKAIALRHLLLDEGAQMAVPGDDRPRWITYGSSITHCRTAHSPAQTWPAMVARKHNLNLTSLGFGGQCHLDPMVAMTIRDLPADFISLKLGINIMRAGSLSPRTFKAAIIGFIRIVREKHPATPIAVISPIYCQQNHRETQPNSVGFTLQSMREEVEDVVCRLGAGGDDHIHYFSGLDLFDETLALDHLPDGLHPDGDGYKILARNFSNVVIDHFPNLGNSTGG